jgi:predicted amidophosphoribosyltransferase
MQQQDTLQNSVRNASPTGQSITNPNHVSQSPQQQRAQNGSQANQHSQDSPQDFTQQCPDCARLIFDGDKFCGSCGYHIQPQQLLLFVRNRGQRTHVPTGPACPRCHHQIVDGMTFCGICGMPLNYSVRSLA